jgi:hypothetical protein
MTSAIPSHLFLPVFVTARRLAAASRDIGDPCNPLIQ